MKKINYILFFAIVLSVSYNAAGQEKATLSQYMFNGIAINPAYAGSREMLSINALYRNQWLGLAGAPKTYTVSVHAPFKMTKTGLGLTIFNDKIGVVNESGIFGNYSYGFNIMNGKLSVGLKAGVSLYKGNFSEINTSDKGDPVFASNTSTVALPNFGLGAYYYNHKYYIGISSPELLKNEVNLTKNSIYSDKKSNQNNHYFLTGGYLVDIDKNIKLKPSFLFRSFDFNIFQIDINSNVIFYDIFWVGASFRTANSFIFLTEYVINKKIQIGYAIDFPNGEVRHAIGPSHEFMIRYEFSVDKSIIISPRYF